MVHFPFTGSLAAHRSGLEGASGTMEGVVRKRRAFRARTQQQFRGQGPWCMEGLGTLRGLCVPAG
jgi:hypothetical protein